MLPLVDVCVQVSDEGFRRAIMIGARISLEISTLGRFELRRGQELLSGGNWNRRKVCELFKVLLSAEQHRLHREQVQEILWPSSTSEQAAKIAKRWREARERAKDTLMAAEGVANFEGLQRFLACVYTLTSEKRLLRCVYLAHREA